MILNLVNPESSDVKFELLSFPDGQQDIKLDIHSVKFGEIDIKARLTSFKDLELIICTVKALNNMGIPGQAISLECNYLLGARSDRKFVEGGTSYLRDVVAPILNSLELSLVKVMDVHSDVAEAVINNLFSKTNKSLVDFAIRDIYSLTAISEEEEYKKAYEQTVIISPDAGAMKKIYGLTKSLGFTGEVICASKHRDIQTGKILSTEVPITKSSLMKNLIIIDDLVDGGKTFIELAKVLHPELRGKIYLVVTHGIFSQGFEELSKYFDGIYCTNSYIDIKELEFFDMKDKIKQLDIWK